MEKEREMNDMMRSNGRSQGGSRRRSHAIACVAAGWATWGLVGCAAVGPDATPVVVAVPDGWSQWHSATASLPAVGAQAGMGATPWWTALNDPVLNQLQDRLAAANADLRTAGLHWAQARLDHDATATQQMPELHAKGEVQRLRISEYSANTRMLDLVAGSNRDMLAQALAQPYTDRQAGLNLSWELDLWGRVRRAIEGAQASVAEQAALLEGTRLSLSVELGRDYVQLRTTQRLIQLQQEDMALAQAQTALVKAQQRHGRVSQSEVESQQAQEASLTAQWPQLLSEEGRWKNRIGWLLDAHPGELNEWLRSEESPGASAVALPDLHLGLPSDLVQRRPDIRAAEARLRQAIAAIGEATAQLYPSIRLGASVGLDSYQSGKWGDWATRTWSVGPSLDLPLFDGGRRRAVVHLRELQQQEAAVAYQRAVLKAWHEVDDALTAYGADQQQSLRLKDQSRSTGQVLGLTQARQRYGLVSQDQVLAAARADVSARRAVVQADGSTQAAWMTVQQTLAAPFVVAGGASSRP